MYEQLSLPLFVTGYLAVVNTVKSELNEVMLKHLHELMVDAATYGWEPLRIYHAVWLQQRENGWANWKKANCKLEFCQAFSWNEVQ